MTKDSLGKLYTAHMPDKKVTPELLHNIYRLHVEQAQEQARILSSSDNLSGQQAKKFLDGSRKVGEAALVSAEAIMEVMLVSGLIDPQEFSRLKSNEIEPIGLELFLSHQ